MSLQEIITHSKGLLREETGRALDFLVPLLDPGRESFNALIQIEGRYNHVRKEHNRGLISSQEKEVTLNLIRSSLLDAIDALTDGDLKAGNTNGGFLTNVGENTLLEKLRASIAELEKLKSENQALQKKHRLKIIVQCEPEINERPNDYTCQCIILDDETGASVEKEVPLRREPGGIVVTIHDINPSDYVQIRIKDNEKEWESEYFSPQFLTQILRLV